MEGDVAAGACAHQVAARKIGITRDPIVGGGLGPQKRFHAVVVGGRETVLRREAVLYGDDEGWGGEGKGRTEVMEHGGGDTEEDETAAVRIDYERQLGGPGGGRVEGCAREEKADGGVGGGVDGDILRENWDGSVRVRRRRSLGHFHDAFDGAVGVAAEAHGSEAVGLRHGGSGGKELLIIGKERLSYWLCMDINSLFLLFLSFFIS